MARQVFTDYCLAARTRISKATPKELATEARAEYNAMTEGQRKDVCDQIEAIERAKAERDTCRQATKDLIPSAADALKQDPLEWPESVYEVRIAYDSFVELQNLGQRLLERYDDLHATIAEVEQCDDLLAYNADMRQADAKSNAYRKADFRRIREFYGESSYP